MNEKMNHIYADAFRQNSLIIYYLHQPGFSAGEILTFSPSIRLFSRMSTLSAARTDKPTICLPGVDPPRSP